MPDEQYQTVTEINIAIVCSHLLRQFIFCKFSSYLLPLYLVVLEPTQFLHMIALINVEVL